MTIMMMIITIDTKNWDLNHPFYASISMNDNPQNNCKVLYPYMIYGFIAEIFRDGAVLLFSSCLLLKS